VGDDDGQEDERVVLGLAIARFVVLELLPASEPVGDEDQEGLRVGDGIKQLGLPQTAVARVGLVDEYVGTRNRLLARMLEAQCDGEIRRVMAQEDAHTKFAAPGWTHELSRGGD